MADLFSHIIDLETKVKSELTIIAKEYQSSKTKEKQLHSHNHPPLVGIFPNCDFCKKYGNILHAGSVHYQDTDIKHYLFQDLDP